MKKLVTPIQTYKIPHNKFHRGRWISTPETNWYHFVPCLREYEIPADKSFYKSLDPEFKKLVPYLHIMGVITTPSCAGHFETPEHYEERYHALVKEAKKITTTGTVFVDPETHTEYYYKEANYKLPFDKHEFVEGMTEYAKNGVLGLVNPTEQLVNAIMEIEHEALNVSSDGQIMLIETSPKTYEELTEVWEVVTQKVKEVSSKFVRENSHKPMNPGILKKRLGKLSCSKVRGERSKLKDKGTTFAKALQRYLNYHCQKK